MKRHTTFTKALVALGANVTSPVGPPVETMRAGLAALASDSITVLAKSRLYATPCMPQGAGPDYVNAVALIQTSLSAKGLLNRLHALEARFARERKQRWASRTLDLDLIDFGGMIVPDAATYSIWRALEPSRQAHEAPDQLILPHPRMQDRAFVLVPLHDVAPDWRHPVSGLTVAQMISQISARELDAIRPIEAPANATL